MHFEITCSFSHKDLLICLKLHFVTSSSTRHFLHFSTFWILLLAANTYTYDLISKCKCETWVCVCVCIYIPFLQTYTRNFFWAEYNQMNTKPFKSCRYCEQSSFGLTCLNFCFKAERPRFCVRSRCVVNSKKVVAVAVMIILSF